MARPIKRNADYFPHKPQGKAMKYIRSKYGNDGYATWFILLEQLTNAEDHHIECDEIQLMLLAGECGVSCEVLNGVIEDLVKMKEFNGPLWNGYNVLYNEDLRDSIADAYRMRSNECITTKELLKKYVSCEVNTAATGFTAKETTLKGGVNTQSKVKRSKEASLRKAKTPKKETNETFIPAERALAAAKFAAENPEIAKSDTELYSLVDSKVRGDPAWWSGIKFYTKIDHMTRDQIELAIKKWATYVIRNRSSDLISWVRIEASLKNWLLRESKPEEPQKVSMS